LAKTLNYRFIIDTDQLIEERQGRSVTAIFCDEGEAFFRELEHKLARELESGLTALVAEVIAELSKRGYTHGDNPIGPCRTEL
jgi:shikimate kinase